MCCPVFTLKTTKQTNQPTNRLHLRLDWHPLNLGFCFQIPVLLGLDFAKVRRDVLWYFAKNLVEHQLLLQYGNCIPMMNQALIFYVGQENKNKVEKTVTFWRRQFWCYIFPGGCSNEIVTLGGLGFVGQAQCEAAGWCVTALDEIQWNYSRWN